MKTRSSYRFLTLAAIFSCALFFHAPPSEAAFLLMPESGEGVDPSLKQGYDAFKNGDFEAAVRFFRTEADKDNLAAQFALGLLYQEGKGVGRSMQSAILWYQKAAMAGHAPSQFNLALLLIEDPSMVEKGISWLKAAAKGNSVKAKLSLGNLYLSGKGVEQDVLEARRWMESAYEDGNAEAAFTLGRLHESDMLKEGVDQEKALAFLNEAANAKFLPAVLHLAEKYRKGIGTEVNRAAAEKWFRFAAEDLKSGQGQMGLGEFFEVGDGKTQDYEEALRWYRKAAGNGASLGYNKIGYFYENGLGVEASLPKAIENYTKAAEKGLTIAMYNLAVFYNSGKGVEKSPAMAAKWLYQASAGGLPIAQNELAVHYREGKGVMQDYLAAMAWFDRAAKSGFIGGMVNLALMHAEGLGTQRNLQMAARYFDLAAQRGDIFSHIQLADMLRHGLGVEKDLVKAWALILSVKKATNIQPKLAEALAKIEGEVGAMLSAEQKKEAVKLLETPPAAPKATPAGEEK